MADHICHAFGCYVKVPPRMLMCKKHWMEVPISLRDGVWLHYQSGQERSGEVSNDYTIAARRAIYAVAVVEEKMTQSEADEKIKRLISVLGGE